VVEDRSISREAQLTESQLSELQNMRVLLEEARVLARNLAYHRRASVEVKLGGALDEVDRQIADLRSRRTQSVGSPGASGPQRPPTPPLPIKVDQKQTGISSRYLASSIIPPTHGHDPLNEYQPPW
jgi:hypothetical protein